MHIYGEIMCVKWFYNKNILICGWQMPEKVFKKARKNCAKSVACKRVTTGEKNAKKAPLCKKNDFTAASPETTLKAPAR